MVVQTEGRWLCDGTDDSICMKLGRVGGKCFAFPSINGKLILWHPGIAYVETRKYLTD
jgi:hypothetical protein